MTTRKIQTRGRKEAQLAINEGIVIPQQQPQVYTPDNAEFHYYQELLKVFFEKLTRWKELLAADEYLDDKIDRRLRGFSVFRSAEGLTIKRGLVLNTLMADDPPGKVLQINSLINQD